MTVVAHEMPEKRVVFRRVKITKYRCPVCGRLYEEEDEAHRTCGWLELEPPTFKPGDIICRSAGDFQRWYLEGTIVELVGPVVGDRTDEKGFRRRGHRAHVYCYKIKPVYASPTRHAEEFVVHASEIKMKA